MTYYYEQLDPERFQHLCQALIVREFPGTQCFPVGQRDGGRDAVQVFAQTPGRIRIFQVKFVRNPFAIPDVHKWVVDVMREELPKLRALMTPESQIVEYLLVTNVGGTSFPGSGSIDTLNSLLQTELAVPIRTWWRDDLDRRCDNAADIRWSYPDMLRGTDLLQALAESGGTDLQGIRLDALRSFAIDQYEDDNEVRFQQVDLSNEILNLFVDVPAAVPEWDDASKRRGDKKSPLIRSAVSRLAQVMRQEPRSSGSQFSSSGEEEPVGAATLLLDDELSRLADLVVLEGGPGQGKSTLGQYICQVHRMKMLGTPEFLGLPDSHQPNSARFPIRVDLREYATWLAGRNPFGLDRDERRPQHLSKSLESFMSFLVSQRSGGRTFTPDDLSIVARSSALLVVLDGLDEVAEVSLRNEVVREVSSAARRLKESAASLQMLVTTRPSALAEVTEFPPKLFHRWSLSRLGRPLIEEYANRWAKSRRLKPKELASLRRVLNDKLDQPHMRDLARNPMQLAILLTVIHTRGSSLPDKRTALYDIYVELFLAREAEKSETVKLRQDLLIDVHRYLAWVLHSEAETGSTLGKIESSRLKMVLRDYLVSEHRDPDLVDELFTGLAQRVVFLVGAVEGLFEFEVQPLREYFAGKYLYETAPYSPVGSPRRGTKDDRFDALARNTHWLNVTRFYAGCFSKGELPSLVDRLEVLCADPDLGLTSHPRSLAATLVADWVFSQNPRSLQKTVEIVLDKEGYHALLRDDSYTFDPDPILTLPEGCGRYELVLRCLDLLKENPKRDVQQALARLAQRNSNRSELTSLWMGQVGSFRDAQAALSWFWSGYFLGVIAGCSGDDLERVLSSLGIDALDSEVLRVMIASGHTEYYVRQRPELLCGYIDSVMQGRVPYLGSRRLSTWLEFFTAAFTYPTFSSRRAFDDRMTLGEGLRHYGLRLVADGPTGEAVDSRVESAATSFAELLSQPIAACYGRGGAFEEFIDKLTTLPDPAWASWSIALFYVKSCTRERVLEAEVDSLFESEFSLVHRLLYARKQAGNVNWWRIQLNSATFTERQIWVCVALVLCGPATVTKLCPDMDLVIGDLEAADFERVSNTVGLVLGWGAEARKIRLGILEGPLSPRLAALIASVAPVAEHVQLSDQFLADYEGSESVILEALNYSMMHKLRLTPHVDWESVLGTARNVYQADASVVHYHPGVARMLSAMPLQAARTVACNPHEYPRAFVASAEVVVKRDIARRAVPLSVVADDSQWFAQEN
ncbi:NACHT domain-containing protein [Streptomyces virginiae]|uniref:NACHT domain-containing protein n=1 Tax=Streptomyces virginiae TaxID=1961 RepID=UPI003690A659